MRAYPFPRRLSSFAGRAVAFFFVLSILLLYIYLVGNYQDFLDSSQIYLLSLLRISLVLELASGFALAVFLGWRVARDHRPFVGRWLLLLGSMVCAFGLLAALRFAQQWFQS
ncbi:MAG TPA: hypothetical protein VFH83_12060 [Spirochaetia bacterium]|nr:hypothetical protein [Spirochaetia bacterium]